MPALGHSVHRADLIRSKLSHKREKKARKEGWRTELLRRNWFMARFWDYCKKRRGLRRGWQRDRDVKRKKLTISDLNLEKSRVRDRWLDLRLLAIDQLLDPEPWFEYWICFQLLFSLKYIFWRSHVYIQHEKLDFSFHTFLLYVNNIKNWIFYERNLFHTFSFFFEEKKTSCPVWQIHTRKTSIPITK
jgi:hypothetical protein